MVSPAVACGLLWFSSGRVNDNRDNTEKKTGKTDKQTDGKTHDRCCTHSAVYASGAVISSNLSTYLREVIVLARSQRCSANVLHHVFDGKKLVFAWHGQQLETNAVDTVVRQQSHAGVRYDRVDCCRSLHVDRRSSRCIFTCLRQQVAMFR